MESRHVQRTKVGQAHVHHSGGTPAVALVEIGEAQLIKPHFATTGTSVVGTPSAGHRVAHPEHDCLYVTQIRIAQYGDPMSACRGDRIGYVEGPS